MALSLISFKSVRMSPSQDTSLTTLSKDSLSPFPSSVSVAPAGLRALDIFLVPFVAACHPPLEGNLHEVTDFVSFVHWYIPST